jgi:hypothetical protein
MPTMLPENAGVSMSEGYAIAVSSNKIGDPLLVALEVRHPDFEDENGAATSYYVVSDNRALTATGEDSETHTYQPIPFRFVPPEQSDSGAPAPARLEIDNVSLQLARLLLMANASAEPVEVVVRMFLRSDTSAPHVLPVLVMEATEPSITDTTVSLSLTFESLTNRKFPARTYTPEKFPGLSQ